VDLLILLTDVEGLCDKNPKLHPDYSIISQVDVIDDTIEKLVEDIDEGITFGGMKSKINAVRKVSTIGIPVIITSFNKSDVLDKIINGHDIGTYFLIQK
jgi:glutamate 5-kinase